MRADLSRSSGGAGLRERAATMRPPQRKDSRARPHPTKPQSGAYELAASIAQQLAGPARWTAVRHATMDETGQRYAELVRAEDGAELGVTVGGYRAEGRVFFRAHWPKYKDGSQYTPREYLRITCSVGRDPRKLARDIERRLLADYEPAYHAALADVRASDAAAAGAADAAQRIAQAIGADATPPNGYSRPSNGSSVPLHGGPSNVYGLKVHPAWGDEPVRVSFDVHSLDEATAIQVLALIARSEPSA